MRVATLKYRIPGRPTSSPRASSVSATMGSSPTAAARDCSRAAVARSLSPRTGRSTTTQSEARTTNASSSFCPRAYASVPTVDAVRCGASKCSDDHLPAITDLVVSQPEGWPRPSAALVPVRACVDIGHPLSFSQCPTHSLPALRRPRPVQSPPPVPAAPTPGLFNPHSPTHRVAAQPN